MKSATRLVLAGLAGLVLLGCDQGPKLYDVSGEVTFDGKALPAGVIYFDPDAARGNDGPQGYAIIKDGKYDTAAAGGAKVVGGPHVVRVEGFDGKPGEELPMGKPLFTDFHQAVELPKSTSQQNFTVPARR